MLKSITFQITGDQRLVCDGCEKRVERIVKPIPGVEKVRARASDQRIEVLFDTAKVQPAGIAERLGKAGFQTAFSSSPSDLDIAATADLRR